MVVASACASSGGAAAPPGEGPAAGPSKKPPLVGAHRCQRGAAIPEWVGHLARQEGGTPHGDDGDDGAVFVASKGIKKSDLVPQQNRFYLPLGSVNANLVPLLSETERAAASLADGGGKRSSRPVAHAAEEGRRAKAAGRAHGGLAVTVFTRCGFRCYLKLTRWDGSWATVIKGDELKLFRAWSCLRPGDVVEAWAFRRRSGGGLCFAIGRRT